MLDVLRQFGSAGKKASGTVATPLPPGRSVIQSPPKSAPHTVTSSSVYPGDDLSIASVVCAAVEAGVSAGPEKPPTGGETPSRTPAKRDRTESHSPDRDRKRPARQSEGGGVAALRESERRWQGRALRLEEDLRKLRVKHEAAEKDLKQARTKWESERTQLVADKTAQEARADRYKTANRQLESERDAAVGEREKLAERVAKQDQDWSTVKSRLEDLQTAADAAELALDESRDELEALRRDGVYVIPSGKVHLAHVPAYTEVLWTAKAKPVSEEPVSADQLEVAWREVSEAMKAQLQDFRAAWQFVEDSLREDPQYNVYGSLHACTKTAVQQIQGALVRSIGRQVTGRRAGHTLADDLVGLPERSVARLEISELEIAQSAEVASLRQRLEATQAELRHSQQLVEQKTKDVSTMHTYGARHADGLRDLSRALQPVAQGLRGLSRQSSTDVRPHTAPAAGTFDSQVDNLTRVLGEVAQRSRPIGMTRRQLPPTPQQQSTDPAHTEAVQVQREAAALEAGLSDGAVVEEVDAREEARLLGDSPATSRVLAGGDAERTDQQAAGAATSSPHGAGAPPTDAGE